MLNMVKNASVQATDIYKDPYGYTYSEMVGVLGEVEADKFYRELYSGSQSSNKYKTITIKEIFRGPDTQKYAFELSSTSDTSSVGGGAICKRNAYQSSTSVSGSCFPS